MSTNANIAIKINGDSTALQSDLKKAQNSLDAFQQKAKAMQARIVAVGIAATAAGVAMTTALYKQQSAIIDRLAKTADALGVTVENLQALRHMSELAGVGAEDLDKAIQRMSKGLGDAARKGGAAADALEDVGINIDDVLSLSADKQMEVLAVALAKVESHTEKASIASDLFGRNGLRMLKVLQQLESEGLQPTIDSIEAMGASLSRVDAAAVEEANDSVAKAMEAVSGLAKELTVSLAPIVQKVADAFTNWVKESGGLRKKLEELQPVLDGVIIAGQSMVVIYGAQLTSAMYRYTASVAAAIFSTSVFEKKLVIAQVSAKVMTAATAALSRAMALLGGPVGLIALAAGSLLMFASNSKKSVVDSKALNVEIRELTFNFEEMSEAAAKVALIDIEAPIRAAGKATEIAQKQAENAEKKLKDNNDSYLKEMKVFRTYLESGYEEESQIYLKRAVEIHGTIPAYEEALTRSNLVLEEAIAQEKLLLEQKAELKNIASGKTGTEDIALTAQQEMEQRKAANDAIITEEQRLNAELLKAMDTSALEQKYSGYFERRQQAQKSNNSRILEENTQFIQNQEALDAASLQRKQDFVTGTSQMFGNLSTLMNSESRKMFNIGKAAAIAQATIDGISAAVSSYRFGAAIGGPLLGGAFAAASAVSTGMMLKQISSQQFGGGAKTASTGGASVPSSTQASGAQSSGGSSSGDVGGTLSVQGLDASSFFTGDMVSALAGELLEYERNGGRVVLSA